MCRDDEDIRALGPMDNAEHAVAELGMVLKERVKAGSVGSWITRSGEARAASR